MIKNTALDQSRIYICNTMKMLLYKEQPALIQKVDFENDRTFLEPNLLAYFNEKERCEFPDEMLSEYLQGYFLEKEEIKTKHTRNHFDVAYLPEIGYVRKDEKKPFLPIVYLGGTSIELLRYPIPLFEKIMAVPKETKAHYDGLYEKHLQVLTNAIHYIKGSNPSHFALIEKCCRRIVIFNTDPSNSNSFASRRANGTAFFNAYQEDYDEVFFVDDVAHQTGHIILTSLFFDPTTIYKIDDKQAVEDIIGKPDHRIINVLIHALYTYYTTFICLDNCLDNNCFTEVQKREAMGRLGFYLGKCTNDLKRFKVVEAHFSGVENMFTEIGLAVIYSIMNTYGAMQQKWGGVVAAFDYTDQTYNFNRALFFAKNKFEQKMAL